MNIKNPRAHEHRDKPVVSMLFHMVNAMHLLGNPPNKYKYLCMEHWVLEHGRYYEWSPHGYRMGPIKQCFRNSIMGTSSYKDLIYVEGYTSTIIPIHHAWLSTKGGRVIDLTLRNNELRESEYGPIGYFGTPMNREWVMMTSINRKHGCSMIDNWEDGYPLLLNDDLLVEALAHETSVTE